MLPPVPLITLFKVMVPTVLDTVKTLAPKLPVPPMVKSLAPFIVAAAVKVKLLPIIKLGVELACKKPPFRVSEFVPSAELLPINKVPLLSVVPPE